MNAFARLYRRLDETNATSTKVEALVDYLANATDTDAAWLIALLSGRRPKRAVPPGRLREWVVEISGLPEWLVARSYEAVGDLAETVSLLLPEVATPTTRTPREFGLAELIETRLVPLREADDSHRRDVITGLWRELPREQVYLLNKLVTGALRVGVSEKLMLRALAVHTGIDTAVLAHRIAGGWQPDAAAYRSLCDPDDTDSDNTRPYPFFLASKLASTDELEAASQWQAEWKWDGIRAQVVRRGATTSIWSRGEELLDGRFPEIEAAAATLPDGTVLDGEVLAWRNSAPLPFAVLQRRIGRLRPGAKMLADAPVAFVAWDLLEYGSVDIRELPLTQRRQQLEQLVGGVLQTHGSLSLVLSEVIDADTWPQLAKVRDQARKRGVEGLMLKRRNSAYQVGRRRGDWWKWKVEPYTIDAVLIYAQPGHGRRSGLFTDYTFAVWSGADLVPVTKAYSGLTNTDIETLDRWIRQHTIDRFGPVRAVEPVHVFELAFEGINRSRRHKSGVAFRFPRISRWRTDLSIRDADTLGQVEQLITDPETTA